MNKAIQEYPFYAKTAIVLVGLIAVFSILFIAKSILVPIVFAIIIATLLHPVVCFIVRFKINRVIAIILTLLLTAVILFGLIDLILSQVNRFSATWPALIEKFDVIIDQAINWAAVNFDINPLKIHEWIAKTTGELMNSSTAAIGQTLVILGNGIVIVFLIPVYVFLILFYQPLLREFITRAFASGNQIQVGEVVSQTKSVIQRYLVGLVLEAVLVAVLDTTALLILGIDYAILLGIIGAILNVIPYIGGLVAVALPMAIAIATKSTPLYALYVMAAYYFIQLVDNNIIVPYVVASKVKINALFSIIVVFIGNAVWGIPGMFLSIPLMAIVKLICDHIESMKPLGFLLGDSMPPILLEIKPILKKIILKSK